MAFIAVLAMVNGALVQLVMVPRVVYGLSRLGLVPAAIGAVSPVPTLRCGRRSVPRSSSRR